MDDVHAIVQKESLTAPWKEALADEESKLSKQLVKEDKDFFNKGFRVFYQFAKLLQLRDGPEEFNDPIKLPLIDGDKEILLAIHLQNLLQPKNAQRRDAITNKKYVEIFTNADATGFMA